MKKISIITTTINIPLFLKNIVKNIILKKSKKNYDISIIVIGDKKTPKNAKKFCNDLKKKYKINILFFDINFQDKYFKKKYPSVYKLFPYNDAIRKLLGSLFVLKNIPDKVEEENPVEIEPKDEGVVLYQPRSKLKGSVICHFGEVHKDTINLENRISVLPIK